MKMQAPSRFADLKQTHPGRPAVIVGGGPSVADHLDEWPDNAIVIGVKEHATLAGIRQDYLVSYDNIWTVDRYNPLKPLIEALPEDKRPKLISRFPWADYQLTNFFNKPNSGLVATWCAHIMGCYPIILTGMDCFSSDAHYFHDKAQSPNGHKYAKDPRYYQRQWREVTMQPECQSIVLRVLGDVGPLPEVFGQYDPNEVIEPPKAPDPITFDIEGPLVKFTRNTLVQGQHMMRGGYAYVSDREARNIVDAGKGYIVEKNGEVA